VKRMLDTGGHPVLKLRRVRFGPLMLGDLPLGGYRFLTDRGANSFRTLVRERRDALVQDVHGKRGKARRTRSRKGWARSAKQVPA